jgi:hypothetical protein
MRPKPFDLPLRIQAICSEFQTKMALETKRNRSRFLSDAAKLSKCLLFCTLLANVGGCGARRLT